MATVDPIFGCRLATGRLDREGYAFHGSTRAHIHAWRTERGDVPDGFELDHLCRRRHCSALHHLELVTRSENEKRKRMGYRMRWKCPRGHEWPLNRAMTPESGVTCRQCNREAIGDG